MMSAAQHGGASMDTRHMITSTEASFSDVPSPDAEGRGQ